MAKSITRQPAGRQFLAAPGAGFTDEQAQKYGAFLEKQVGLGQRVVAPEEIVNKAKPKTSPLHEAFEWDDAQAGHLYRVGQARHLVSHIVITQKTKDGDVTTRAFHNVVAKPPARQGAPVDRVQRGYITERIVWRDPQLSKQVIADALRELRGWRDRYAVYSYLQGSRVWKVVDQVLREHDDDAEAA